MGNCAGCTGPQRKSPFKVSRLQQHSPIKDRLSTSKLYYKPVSQNNRQFSFNQKDKLPQRDSYNQNDIFRNLINMSNSKSNINQVNQITQPNQNNQPNQMSQILQLNQTNQNYQADYINQSFSAKRFRPSSHIKLVPDQSPVRKDSTKKMERSYVYQKDDDSFNQRMQQSRKQNPRQTTFSNVLLNSVQTQSRRYLHQSSLQKPLSKPSSDYIITQFIESSSKPIQFDQLSSIHQSNSFLPLKPNRYQRNLSVIQEMLQEDHKTPVEVQNQRKQNGEDAVFDHVDHIDLYLEEFKVPDMQYYLSKLKLVQQIQ